MPWGFAIGAVGAVIAGGEAADAQDSATAAQERTAAKQGELGDRQLSFDERVYDEGKPARDRAEERAGKVSDAQLEGMKFAVDQAKNDKEYNEGTFRPVEKSLVADAQGYDTQSRRTDAANSAMADVDTSFAAAREGNDRALSRSGIAPGSGKAMSLMQDAAIAQGAARAGAGTMAVRNVEQQGHARMVDAASLGRNMSANQATQQNISTNAGNSSVAAAQSGIVAQQAGIGAVNTGFQGAINAGNSAGNLFGDAARSYGSTASGMGSAVGQIGSAAGNYISRNGMPSIGGGSIYTGSNSGAGGTFSSYTPGGEYDYYSDEDKKSDTDKPVDKDAALEEINATPVKEGWKYDPAKGGPDDGGKRHTGPMAQKVRSTMGEAVAPGGKVIDIASMNGKMLAGMQALTQRVQKLEKRKAA